MAPETLGGDAASVFYVDEYLPQYFEMKATINAGKPMAGLKSNAYLIFDYQGAFDFKFAGVNASTDKLQMGHRTVDGWIVDVQIPMQVRSDTDYNLLLALNGITATLVVNNNPTTLTYAFSPRTDAYGFTYGLNNGLVGIGANNATGRIDNVAVQVLPPEMVMEAVEEFGDGTVDLPFNARSGDWQDSRSRYTGTADGQTPAVSLIDLGLATGLSAPSVLRLHATGTIEGAGGVVFDYYGPNDFKYAELDVEAGQVVIGHRMRNGKWVRDAVADIELTAGAEYDLGVSLKGRTVSVTVNGQAILGHSFNGVAVDGGFGLLSHTGQTSFDAVTVMTDDRALEGATIGYSLIPADANGDGFVDDSDLAVVLSNWEQDPGDITAWELGDFTGDNDVDDTDLAVVLGNWTGNLFATLASAEAGGAAGEPASALSAGDATPSAPAPMASEVNEPVETAGTADDPTPLPAAEGTAEPDGTSEPASTSVETDPVTLAAAEEPATTEAAVPQSTALPTGEEQPEDQPGVDDALAGQLSSDI